MQRDRFDFDGSEGDGRVYRWFIKGMAHEDTEVRHRAYDEAKELDDLLTFPYLQQKVTKAKK